MQMTEIRETRKEDSKVTIVFTNLQYLVLIGLLVAQSVVGANFYIGQFIYLTANIIAVVRNFVLRRPLPDKVKDCSCLGVTIGLILFNFFLS